MPTAQTYAAVYLRDSAAEWPADIGDDPSFAWSHDKSGPLTWGVCRPDVRNPIVKDGVVVFFAADSIASRKPARYVWVGFATVERKVSQVDLFQQTDLASLRQYPNLLIRPICSGVFQHFEPELARRCNRPQHHDDWLWRLVDPRSTSLKKADFDQVHASHHYDPGSACIKGTRIHVAPNYVIFAGDRSLTWIAEEPPLVAEAATNGKPETWRANDPLAKELHDLLFRGVSRTTLRTTNRQMSHRHVRLAHEPADLRRELLDLAERHGLARRAVSPPEILRNEPQPKSIGQVAPDEPSNKTPSQRVPC